MKNGPTQKFDLIVEATAKQQPLELNNLEWKGDNPPDIIVMPAGKLLVRVGRYASPGERWCYRVAVVAHMVGNKLMKENE